MKTDTLWRYLASPAVTSYAEVAFYMEESQPNDDCSVVWEIREYEDGDSDYGNSISYRTIRLDKIQGELYRFSFPMRPSMLYSFSRDRTIKDDVAIGDACVVAISTYNTETKDIIELRGLIPGYRVKYGYLPEYY